MGILEKLEPYAVFHYFEEICGIPHGSGNTKQISDYLVAFAKEHKLSYRQDENNNVIIKKPGTKGYEGAKPVIIQGHMDMVCAKEADCDIDFSKDGLRLCQDGEYIYAKGTTLGADDGIAVAFALAILSDTGSIKHPPIEAVFTVDEEIGLLGATYLDCSDLKGHYLLNLDSEEEGYLLTSCAGGATANFNFPVEYESKEAWKYMVKLAVVNAFGGHSGVLIDRQGANANVALGRILNELLQELDYRLVTVSGGKADNVITREAHAVLAVLEEKDIQTVKAIAEKYDRILREEFANTDKNIAVTTSEIKLSYSQMTKEMTSRFVQALVLAPNGTIKMSHDIAGVVQTSLNFGVLEMTEDTIHFGFLVRSSKRSEMDMLLEKLKVLAGVLHAGFEVESIYPGWEYKRKSPLRELMIATYKQLYGVEPVVQGIHAGLECGVFTEKIKDLDCVSYGPWIYDIHTTKERLLIASVARTWDYTLAVLEKIRE